LSQFAVNRGIVIIPEVSHDAHATVPIIRLFDVHPTLVQIDMPAHNSQLINAYPDFGCLAYSGPNTTYRCLIDPTNDQFFKSYYAMWAELHAIFPQEWPFMIGGDEVRSVSTRLPR